MESTCSSCGFVNLDWARQCSQCGRGLGHDQEQAAVVLPGGQEPPPPDKRCPDCGFVNLDWARQCTECGGALPGVSEQKPVVMPQDEDDGISDIDEPPPGPRGIGGWLIIPIIQLLVVSFNAGLMFIRLLDVGPSGSSYVVFFTVANGACAVAAVLLLLTLFQMRRSLPTMMIYFYLGIAALAFLDFIWTGSLVQDRFVDRGIAEAAMRNLLRNLVAAAIWIPYFSISERVKNTFTC